MRDRRRARQPVGAQRRAPGDARTRDRRPDLAVVQRHPARDEASRGRRDAGRRPRGRGRSAGRSRRGCRAHRRAGGDGPGSSTRFAAEARHRGVHLRSRAAGDAGRRVRNRRARQRPAELELRHVLQRPDGRDAAVAPGRAVRAARDAGGGAAARRRGRLRRAPAVRPRADRAGGCRRRARARRRFGNRSADRDSARRRGCLRRPAHAPAAGGVRPAGARARRAAAPDSVLPGAERSGCRAVDDPLPRRRLPAPREAHRGPCAASSPRGERRGAADRLPPGPAPDAQPGDGARCGRRPGLAPADRGRVGAGRPATGRPTPESGGGGSGSSGR